MQVAISESDLIYVLDSIGRVTVINRELNNPEHGVIFVLKKTNGAKKFFLLSELQGFTVNEPKDSVQKFKRENNLEPCGFMVTVSDK